MSTQNALTRLVDVRVARTRLQALKSPFRIARHRQVRLEATLASTGQERGTAHDGSPFRLMWGPTASEIPEDTTRTHGEIDKLSSSYKLSTPRHLSLIHISEPTRPERISYAVFCLKKK